MWNMYFLPLSTHALLHHQECDANEHKRSFLYYLKMYPKETHYRNRQKYGLFIAALSIFIKKCCSYF